MTPAPCRNQLRPACPTRTACLTDFGCGAWCPPGQSRCWLGMEGSSLQRSGVRTPPPATSFSSLPRGFRSYLRRVSRERARMSSGEGGRRPSFIGARSGPVPRRRRGDTPAPPGFFLSRLTGAISKSQDINQPRSFAWSISRKVGFGSGGPHGSRFNRAAWGSFRLPAGRFCLDLVSGPIQFPPPEGFPERPGCYGLKANPMNLYGHYENYRRFLKMSLGACGPLPVTLGRGSERGPWRQGTLQIPSIRHPGPFPGFCRRRLLYLVPARG